MEAPTLKSFYTLSEANSILTITVHKRFSVSEFKEILVDIKEYALGKNITKLLLDAYTVDFSDLKMSERHDIGLVAAELLKGGFKAVMVVQKPFINKHGENVANNRGADVLVTDSIEEARQWLLN
jgi:hypothetical protein